MEGYCGFPSQPLHHFTDRPMYTAPAIEDLILATLGDKANARERHMLRQSLLNLVRLARAEQCAEMQASVDRAVHAMPSESVLLA